MIRTLGTSSQIIRKTGWHTDSMRRVGTYENMDKAFIQAAKGLLAKRGITP